MIKEMTKEELLTIEGGGAGSPEGARLAGRIVGTAIGGPFALLYYIGCDMGIW